MLPLLLSLSLLAADPPPTPGPIRLPAIARVADPAPQPMPAPDAPVAFPAGTVYAFDSAVECVVKSYPPGCVAVSKKKGPRDISAKFVGGTGEDEDRSFEGPFVYVVRATHSGCTDLVIIPVGLKSEAEIATVKFDVLGGCKVGPTPTPPAPPTPGDPFAAAVLSAYRADAATDKAAKVAALASVYRIAAVTTAADPGVKTFGDLFDDMTSASRAIGVPPAPYLAGVRKAVGDRLGKSLEPRSGGIDRGLAAKELTAVADALAGCK